MKKRINPDQCKIFTDTQELLVYSEKLYLYFFFVLFFTSSLAAGYIASMLKGLPSRQCMHNGMSCALTSLESHLSVPASLAAPKTDFELISTEIPTSGRFYDISFNF